MSDEDDFAPLPRVAPGFVVNPAHQRTGRVDHLQTPNAGVVLDLAGHAVGAEYRDGAPRNFRDFLDEASALVAQAVDDMLVVDDFVANVDGRAINLQRALDDIDRADHPGAEPPGLRQNHLHGWFRHLKSPTVTAR